MNVKKVISEEVEARIISTVLEFAKKEELTIDNIRESLDKVCKHMEENAILK